MTDLTNLKFNRWTVVARALSNTSHGHPKWVCFCDCGKAKEVSGSDLKSGKSKSCGCLSIELVKKREITHNMSKSPEFSIWAGILSRCNNPNSSSYMFYGGRGIRCCDRWIKFENFFEDMGNRPSKEHSIERINLNGDYTPENCKWATKTEQSRNRRNNKFLTINGKTKILQDWLSDFGIKKGTYYARLKRGWSEQRALEIQL